MSTSARDKLAAAQAHAAELRATVAQLWAAAEAGQEVDAAQIVQAEAEAAVSDKMSPALQRLAQAEQQAESEAAWQVIEQGGFAQHQQLAAGFHDKLNAARLAMAEVVDSAVELDAHLQAFKLDQRRPPVLVDGFPQEHTDRSMVGGQRLQCPGPGDVVLALAADGLDRCAERGVRAWGEFHRQATNVRQAMTMPDP